MTEEWKTGNMEEASFLKFFLHFSYLFRQSGKPDDDRILNATYAITRRQDSEEANIMPCYWLFHVTLKGPEP